MIASHPPSACYATVMQPQLLQHTEASDKALPHRLRDLARMALVTGTFAVGGSYVVLAKLREEMVAKKRWLTGDEFQLGLEMSQSLPGTAATNFFTYVAWLRGGPLRAALIAATFVLPSALLMVVLALLYPSMRNLGPVAALLDGMGVAAVAVVAKAARTLARPVLTTPLELGIAFVGFALLVLGLFTPILLIAAFGVLAMIIARVPIPLRASAFAFPMHAVRAMSFPVLALGTLGLLALGFAHVSFSTFGGGYAMIAALQHLCVVSNHWLGSREFTDAITFGQITPGPVAITATYVGFRAAGLVGAIVATVGMFLPPFLLTGAATAGLAHVKERPWFVALRKGITLAVIAVLLQAIFVLARSAIITPEDIILCAVAMVLAMATRLESMPIFLAIGGMRLLLTAF